MHHMSILQQLNKEESVEIDDTIQITNYYYYMIRINE